MAELRIDEMIEQISYKMVEDYEKFIFESIRPYCESTIQMEISKDDLTEALMIWKNHKRGNWNDIPKYTNIAWKCSECGHFTTMKHNYCPNCGAKMGVENEK